MASLTHKESVTAVAKANDNFTSKLYGHLVSTAGKDSNMVVSPFSISAVMAMAYAGARENTAMQMQSVLSFPEKDLTLQEGYEEMFNVLQSNENFTLEAANRLFIHEKYKLLDTYINMVKKHYNALPESVDFGKSEEARSIINTWVENQTKEKIRDLLPSGSIDPLTHVVLVNAVYFKGDWKIKFEEADTCKKKFRTTAGKKVDVDMMHKTAKYKAARIKDLDCTVLEMPYKGDRLNMLLFLSKESKGFDVMEDKFASLDIVNLEMHGECEFHVSLPRFKLETSHDLVDNLKAIGLTDMFGSNADFSGIDGSKNLYVKCVMQKAFIEVNEEGSEAAAATAMVINYKSSRVTHPQTFICNRPFLFAIKDQLTGMVLFTGRVANPNKDYKPNCATIIPKEKIEMAANMILAHKESTLAVTKANQDFTSKLYALLVSSAGKDSNMVVSPFSISAVMAMAFAGAKGSTAEQMKTVLAFPEKDQVLMEGYEDLSNILKSSDNFTLDAANRLFVQENFKLLESYTHRVRCHFQALPESVNFLQGEEARGTINCWVEKQTHEKIKDLIPVGALSVDTRLVLVNAIYFKGDWENKFNTEATSQDKFTTAKATEVTASMMHQEVKCRSNHSKELGCTVLEMPYKGKRLSMLIFLSHTPGGFDAMEEKFTALDMANLELMPEIKYAIALPKFKLETSHDLVSNLKAVGLVDMFVPGMADFSGITGSKDLHVSSVVQKAFIEVNEEGSEAAAATGMMMQVMCMPTPPKKFICNRPFLFAIKDNLSGMILFTGRVVDPTKGK